MAKAEALNSSDQSYFIQNWRIYRKVLDRNLMMHREVSALLREVVAAAPAGFGILDIACGDAAATANALAGSAVGRYFGIDISREALSIAADELSVIRCRVHLIEGDLRPALATWSQPVDVVWLGQSLHHFLPDEKQAILFDIRRALLQGGTFMLWEPALLPGEERNGWLRRFAGSRSHWSDLADEEWDIVYNHSATSDFPETEEDWIAMAARAGLNGGRVVLVAPLDLGRVFLFDG
jgi:hypothetical protein